MKTFLKKYWVIALGSLVIIVFAVDKVKLDNLRDQNQLQSVELATLQDTVTLHVSKSKLLTSKVKAVEVESRNRKKALELMGVENKELKERNIKLSDVNSLLNANLVAVGTGTTILKDTMWVTKHDTVYASNYNWQNKFLSLNGTIAGKQMTIDYRYQVAMTFATERKGKVNIVSAYLSDPNAQMVTMSSVIIADKKKWPGWKWVWFGSGVASGYFLFK